MISIKNVKFAYRKKDFLFNDFCLETEYGSILGLLGKNGSGKTTLLKLISGLLKPLGGIITNDGYIPFERNPDFLSEVYMVPEDFDLPSVTIKIYCKATSPLYPSFDHEMFKHLLNEFELNESEQINKLSHGTKKKFLIAFALATKAKILLLDEPTNGLDIPSKSIFRKVLVSSVSDEQLVIISTHQVKDIDTVIDKVLIIDEGKTLYYKDLFEISEYYHFDTANSLSNLENVIYSEKCPLGYKFIQPVNGKSGSVIDMELLFNAIVNKKIS
jgi:ABC-2 type transport system ATP-binding protein